MAKSLSHVAPVRALGVFEHGDHKYTNSTFDILITTPRRLQRLRTDEAVFLSRLCSLVFDEADMLLDPSFCDSTIPLIVSRKKNKNKNKKKQKINKTC